MNSRETLTCNLFHLPQDIFRVIFQYLSVEDLMKGEKAFLNNQELLSLYRSSLEGFTSKATVNIQKEDEELLSWIIDRKLLVEKLELWDLRDLSMDLFNQSRSSLRSINFWQIYSDNSVPALGHFPSLTSVTFEDSQYFTFDQLLSFFSDNPQLEIIDVDDLTNEILPHLSNYCPKIKILSLSGNNWANNETISLLTEQRLFPNVKSLNLYRTKVTNQDTLRQLILSHPRLSGLLLPHKNEYSDEFLIFYLRQVIFPSIPNRNNDLESHSLAISSLSDCVGRSILDGRNNVVNPEIFSVDILSHFYRKDCSSGTLRNSTEIFCRLSKFPSMIDSILQSQFIPFILDYTRPEFILSGEFGTILFNCGIFHDYFPLLVEKYRTHPSSLFWIFHHVTQSHFSDLTTEELQTIVAIALNKLPHNGSACNSLDIISKLLQEPSSQHLIDPNTLLFSFKSIDFVSFYYIRGLFDCLKRFISVNENYQQLFIESNLISQMMTVVNPSYLIDFANHCLSLSQDGLLVDHLVDSGLFQKLLSNYCQFLAYNNKEMASLFKVLIEFKNNKYSEVVRKMELPNGLRVKLFEKREEECRERERG